MRILYMSMSVYNIIADHTVMDSGLFAMNV